MKKTDYYLLILITILLCLFIVQQASSQEKFNQDKFISLWVDPTFTDNGAQFGASFLMEYKATFVEYSISHYNPLEPSYTDLTVTYGVVANLSKFDIYLGGRLGFIYREKDNVSGLAGIMTRLQYPLINKLHLGLQLHFDYRGDLTNDFFRENGSIYLSWKL